MQIWKRDRECVWVNETPLKDQLLLRDFEFATPKNREKHLFVLLCDGCACPTSMDLYGKKHMKNNSNK